MLFSLLLKFVKAIGWTLLYAGIFLLALFVLPLLLVVWPFEALGRRKEEKKLRDSWLPKKKYILLAYEKHSGWKKFIEEQLLPRYGEHIITEEIDSNENSQSPKLTFELKIIEERLLQDCDCGLGEVKGHSGLGVLLVTPEEVISAQLIGEYDKDNKPFTKTSLEEKIKETIALWQ